MSKDNFYKNSIILTLSNLATGVLRFLFSIILSKELGSEGLGLYSLVMPIYDLFCCLICGGMITAISKEASHYYSKNDYGNLIKTVHISFLFDLIWGILITVLFLIFSPLISKYIIKDNRTIYSLWAISPALIFVALSSIFKGYFYGTSKVKVPAFIDVFEKAIRMIAIVSLIKALSVKHITYAVTVSYIALTLGELLSFILLGLYYKFHSTKVYLSTQKEESSIQLLFNLLVVAIPLCINGFLTTAISSCSTLLIPRRLVAAGIEYTTALSMIGKFSGMALTIVFFPMVVIMSISTLLIPDISKSIAINDFYGLEKRIKEVMLISLLLGLGNLVICLCIPKNLGIMFFGRDDLGEYIKLAAYSAPFVYMSSSSYSILNGLGNQKKVLINSLISSVLEICLFYVLLGIPHINIYGFGITFLIVGIVSLTLNFIDIHKMCPIHFSIPNIIISLLSSWFLYYILKILNKSITHLSFFSKNMLIIFLGFSLFFISVFIIQKGEE
ncbi:stage V sporulation protein B [Hathewaya limosa]|uniref:Multidrug-efflux transporter n=1 Tax=Hathewaya limosa TaxID=1536 RepID=A0ABU0JPZ5_HATLI|nr:stage V sporulation protein B [Hathewaya limosa]MDQ0479162.1 stage V sporulation protein B [Hathewaya limosa]